MSEESKSTNEMDAIIPAIKKQYERTLQFRGGDGYFNMSDAARAYGKDVYEFLSQPSTSEYMHVLVRAKPEKTLIEVKSNSSKPPTLVTWAHPLLALLFIRWLDAGKAVVYDLMMQQVLDGSAQLSMQGQQRDIPKIFYAV